VWVSWVVVVRREVVRRVERWREKAVGGVYGFALVAVVVDGLVDGLEGMGWRE